MNEPEVRIDMMRPAQIAAARKHAEIGFLPLGAIEWHGVHGPQGVDSIKSHHVCCEAARRLGGGAVFPPLAWGLPRDSFFMNKVSSDGDNAEPIARALGADVERVRGFCAHGGMDVQEQWLFYQRLLRMSLEQIAGYGFKSIYVLSGHNPLLHWSRPTAVTFARASWMAGQPVNVDCGNEFDAAGLDLGDHAGRWETSITMAIAPDAVDLEELRSRKDYRYVGCGPDALDSTAEQGAEWITRCADAVARDARWLIDNHPESPPHMDPRR